MVMKCVLPGRGIPNSSRSSELLFGDVQLHSNVEGNDLVKWAGEDANDSPHICDPLKPRYGSCYDSRGLSRQ